MGLTRRWVPALVALGAGAAVAWHRWVTPWHERWGATDDEVGMALPGDELVAEPARQATRAISIDADPGAVWPWIIQLGADRAGFYSYEWLENLFGLGIHNSDVIVTEWQQRAVGEAVLGNAQGTTGWQVMEVRPGDALVLQAADLRTGRPIRRDQPPHWEFVWTFVVRSAPGGGSRLLVRERTGFGSRFMAAALSPIGFVSFVMTQKMLRGIRARAEAASTTVG